jgi:hypothetical protein
MHVTLMRAYVMIEQLLAISRRSTSKYTRKGLTFSMFIVTFKPDWREGGKGSTSLFWEMDTAFCRAEDEP